MARYKAAVVIPAKNAMQVLPQVLDKVLAQRTAWPFEVIVIDSGSRDGTKEFLRAESRIRLIEIAPESFGHGRTRNQGVAAADAEFVAFLTHDAEPVDEHWLAKLVEAAERDERIAGVFGRHIAYPSASPFTRQDLDQHFRGFLQHPLVVHKALDAEKYQRDEGWRQFLHFYSDNNSLLRKAVWEKIPYPDVEFAEDQLWARAVIEAGYHKAYAPDAVVYHSHDYSFTEQLRRAFDESRNFTKYFGYRLSPNPRQAIAAMGKFTWQAFRQRLDPAYGPVTFTDRLSRAAQRIALVSGHCLGANHSKLPQGLADRLSLDNRLFKS
ncbi:glycosyltransferase family 2 protein [Rhizobium paknamense]|uniref:Rhamnosyltransferase n=1 Tax=Rhizobium paknamense TaxID=1206817 RepID=A0ABU0I9G0_9HYPH|nr:glycosyltransferase family 2 protein [Rhizobium paknamense]MDQ0454876.1 rhamnosyltransferase [Rhizobium paknamense]